jgi:hypothetical protein
VLETLAEQLFAKGRGTKINLLVMDGAAPFGMHQIFNSILGETETRQSFFAEHNVVVTWMADANDTFRREFLDRYRKQVHFEPASRAEILLQAEGKAYELGVVSSDNEGANYLYEKVQNGIQDRLSSSDVKVELRNIHGALFKFNQNWDPVKFRQEDYDNKPGHEQFNKQKALGRQNMYQFVKKTGVEEALNLNMEKVSSYFSESLKSVQMEPTLTKQYDDVGDGGLILAWSTKGYATLVWDGREQISVNLFTYNEDIGVPEKFAGFVLKSSGQKLQIGLRDDQPRGINRVINFPSDMVRKPPKKKQVPKQKHQGRPKMERLPNGEYVPAKY